jgi:hypothetical protein
MDVHNFTTELELIQQFVKNGSSELFYFDESGFSLETNIPYAWQEINTRLLLPKTKSKNIKHLQIINTA